MQKSVSVAVGAILIGGALGAWYFFSPSSSPVQGDVAVEITYTEDGYSPSEVTIQKGQAVRWVNNSEWDMWPASAVHPTHSLYPGKDDGDCLGSSFDACDYFAPGASWEYTFEYVGDWKFHDHIRASKTGTIHVTE